MNEPMTVNSREAIEDRLSEGCFPGFSPYLRGAARPVFILLVQVMTFLLMKLFEVYN